MFWIRPRVCCWTSPWEASWGPCKHGRTRCSPPSGERRTQSQLGANQTGLNPEIRVLLSIVITSTPQRCTRMRIYACLYVCNHVPTSSNACMHVCMHARMYACMHVCTYVWINNYIRRERERERDCDRSASQLNRRPSLPHCTHFDPPILTPLQLRKRHVGQAGQMAVCRSCGSL